VQGLFLPNPDVQAEESEDVWSKKGRPSIARDRAGLASLLASFPIRLACGCPKNVLKTLSQHILENHPMLSIRKGMP